MKSPSVRDATPGEVVYVVWQGIIMSGMYATQSSADAAAARLRGSGEDLVGVEKWIISP